MELIHRKRKNIVITIIIIASALALVSVGAVGAKYFLVNQDSTNKQANLKEDLVTVESYIVSSQTIDSSLNLSGITDPLDEVKISPKMSGKVMGIFFQEGDWVNAGQTIIQLEQDQTLQTAYNNAWTNLNNTRASTNQDIKTGEVAVEAARVTLENTRVNAQENVKNAELAVEAAQIALTSAEKTLKNTGVANEQAIEDAYTNALNSSRNAVLTGVNGLISLTELQYKYFMSSSDQRSLNITEKKALAVYELLGEPNAGGYDKQFIGQLNGGVKGQVEEAIINPNHENIDQILIDIVPALQKVRDALSELRFNLDWVQASSTEKASIDTIRAGIDVSLTSMSAAKQVITNAKLGTTTGNDAAQSAYDAAKISFERAEQNLVSIKAQARTQVDAVQKQFESAEANLASIKEGAALQIDLAQGQLDSVQAQISNTIITAPIAGTINQKYVEVGEMAMAGSPIANIVNTQGIEIELSLTEFDIGKVFIGQEAKVSLSAYSDEEFIGQVYYVSSVADSMSKKFPIKIQLDNKDGRIKAGMVADVKIITAKQENVLTIPKSAVFVEDGVEKVYAVENSMIKIKNIKTESANDNELKVIEGLIEGDEIVIEGNYELKEGDKVNIL